MTRRLRMTIIGGAGFVGTELLAARQETWDAHVIDIVGSHPLAHPSTPVSSVDILNEAELALAVSGSDAVVHLANVPVRSVPPYEPGPLRQAFAVNVGSVYTTIRACASAGVPSFIYISSLSVFSNPLAPTPTGPGDSVELYGMTKRLAEEVCESLSTQGPSVTALRIGFPTPDEDWPLWRRPSDRRAVPIEIDGESLDALRISDLAQAIDLLAVRRGEFIKLALAGDKRLAPRIDELAAAIQGATR